MQPQVTLKAWADECSRTDIQWYLYRETLLCAEGYHEFPECLQDAQVAVFAKDLPKILESVVPGLPASWKLCKQDFVTNKCALCFKEEDRTVLSIAILYSVEDQKKLSALEAKLNKIRGRNSVILKLFRKLPSMLIEKDFRKLVALAAGSDQSLPYCCDAFTEGKPMLMEREIFTGAEEICCGEWKYPVFAGYKQYLSTVYGDYEKGLFDEIGCGLTPEEKEELLAHQKKCEEALAFVQRVGKQYDLRYYLIAGSVLGAVRHGGFIPWDDDVDIGVRVDELEVFEAKIKEHLPEGFTLEQSGANNPYPRMFSKICYNGRCCIDIWPLVPTYVDGLKAKLTWYFAKIITKAHYEKIGHEVTRFRKIVKLMCIFLSDKAIMALARWNERKFVKKNAPAYINIYSIYRRDKETIRRRWLDTQATAMFHGIEVPIVGCTEEYLTHLYGDYMAYPAPWKRASRHVARF